MTNKVVVFDLDDTLYPEIDFLKSAYREIALLANDAGAYSYMMECYAKGQNVFRCFIDKYHIGMTVDDLLDIYRNHVPHIQLSEDTKQALRILHRIAVLGIITDGRIVTQTNKIKALGLDEFIPMDNIVISEVFGYEKPLSEPYLFFETRFPGCRYTYIGDNISKDFVAPNHLGWNTICLLDKGYNIHSQRIDVEQSFCPQSCVESLCRAVQLI